MQDFSIRQHAADLDAQSLKSGACNTRLWARLESETFEIGAPARVFGGLAGARARGSPSEPFRIVDDLCKLPTGVFGDVDRKRRCV